MPISTSRTPMRPLAGALWLLIALCAMAHLWRGAHALPLPRGRHRSTALPAAARSLPSAPGLLVHRARSFSPSTAVTKAVSLAGTKGKTSGARCVAGSSSPSSSSSSSSSHSASASSSAHQPPSRTATRTASRSKTHASASRSCLQSAQSSPASSASHHRHSSSRPSHSSSGSSAGSTGSGAGSDSSGSDSGSDSSGSGSGSDSSGSGSGSDSGAKSSVSGKHSSSGESYRNGSASKSASEPSASCPAWAPGGYGGARGSASSIISCQSDSFSATASSTSTKSSSYKSKESSAASKSWSTSASSTSHASGSSSGSGSDGSDSGSITSWPHDGYTVSQLRTDLKNIMAWAGDSGQLKGSLFEETVQAVWNAAARYLPDVPATASCRILLAQMRVESDFEANMVDGSAWGLLQVTPGEDSSELTLFKQHASVSDHVVSWEAGKIQSGTGSGPLTDYQSSSPLDVSALTTQDLLRPWVNIHVAVWIQSNLARTGSNDPYNWTAIARLSQESVQSSSSSDRAATETKLNKYLKATKLPYSMETALGSWIAGPATDGDGSYHASGDTLSASYLSTVLKGVKHLYGNQSLTTSFFDKYTVHPGLVDYQL